MSEYITNKPPTLIERVLTYFGFGITPYKVNCWYCCQDSYILPGSKNTVDQWYCNLCESTNIRDKNGEIADPKPFEPLNTKSVPAFQRSASTIQVKSANTLCSDCVANQEIIYRHLAEYIPDETDPTYEIKFNDVDEYKSKLHQRYKLCRDCQDKIRKLNEDQRAFIRQQRFTASVLQSSLSTAPKKPSIYVFHFRGFLWYTVHIWTIFFGSFCILFPPQSVNINVPDILLRSYDPTSLQDLVKSIGCISSLWDTFIMPLQCILSTISDESCYWAMGFANLFILALMTILSFVVRGWHHLLKDTTTEKLIHYRFYNISQKSLILVRCLLFAFIVFIPNKKAEIGTLAIYIILLLTSYNVVKCYIWPYARIGKNSRSLEIDEGENEDEFIEDMDIVPNESSPPQLPLQQQQHYEYHQQHRQQQQYYHYHPQQQVDAVDSIVNGLHQIAF
ncbi:Ima1 N-terminal domain-containing protein [Parasitella parasitica]|nr:Ima1 N-terminal domain-containing protein [Parasitella parasitica]